MRERKNEGLKRGERGVSFNCVAAFCLASAGMCMYGCLCVLLSIGQDAQDLP
jgi:hypothetical protein